MNAPPRNQHYLPQWYQNRFAADGTEQVGAFNRKNGKELPLVSTRNIGAERDFYTFKHAAKSNAYHIEKQALTGPEGNGGGLLEGIASRGNVRTSDVPALRELLSLMHMRTKVYRELCERAVKHGFTEVAADGNGLVLPAGFPSPPPDLPPEDVLRDLAIQLQMGRIPMLLKVLQAHTWLYRLVQLPDDCFLTSDDPVLARSRASTRRLGGSSK